jgi:hypothetical protein
VRSARASLNRESRYRAQDSRSPARNLHHHHKIQQFRSRLPRRARCSDRARPPERSAITTLVNSLGSSASRPRCQLSPTVFVFTSLLALRPRAIASRRPTISVPGRLARRTPVADRHIAFSRRELLVTIIQKPYLSTSSSSASTPLRELCVIGDISARRAALGIHSMYGSIFMLSHLQIA